MSKYREEYIKRLANRTGKDEACMQESLKVASGDSFLPAPRPEGEYMELTSIVIERWVSDLNEWLEDVDEVLARKLEGLSDERV